MLPRLPLETFDLRPRGEPLKWDWFLLTYRPECEKAFEQVGAEVRQFRHARFDAVVFQVIAARDIRWGLWIGPRTFIGRGV